MARNTKALVMAVSMMFSNNLYECGPIDGYKFPVYTTASCPQNEREWLERSIVLNCTDQNGYMCMPNDMITVLVEFCYTKNVEPIPEGICLILNKRSDAVDAYECHHFPNGCPSDPYFSNVIYEHQSCVSIVEGCFLADPYCERTESSYRKTTTSKYNTEEGIGTNNIRIGTSFSRFWIIIIFTIVSSLIAGQYLKIGITKIIKKITETCGEGSNDQATELLLLENTPDLSLEGSCGDETESSLNENSNQGPLTNHASVQTTELLKPVKIQDMSLEGPRADVTESSLNENSNQGPLTNHASVQTTELLKPVKIQDMSLEGTRAESSLNENSNQGPPTNHASVQTTELLIPVKIQDMPFEGPRADETESSLNENSNQGPLKTTASVQTTELLIPDNIQDIPPEGPQAGSKESLNQNSNPRPLTDRTSDQTTEPLIPTDIQDTPLEGQSGASAASGARRLSCSKPHRQRVRKKEILDEISTLFKENFVDP